MAFLRSKLGKRGDGGRQLSKVCTGNKPERGCGGWSESLQVAKTGARIEVSQ